MTMGALPPKLMRLSLGAYGDDLRILLKRAYDEGVAFEQSQRYTLPVAAKSFNDWYKWVMEE